jgi:hypothetical protein
VQHTQAFAAVCHHIFRKRHSNAITGCHLAGRRARPLLASAQSFGTANVATVAYRMHICCWLLNLYRAHLALGECACCVC